MGEVSVSARTPSLAEKHDRTLNQLIDTVGDRNMWRRRALTAENQVRLVERVAVEWSARADRGVVDPTWAQAADLLLSALLLDDAHA